MQLSVYVSEADYETLSRNRPADIRTVSQFLADILRKKAEAYRAQFSADGTPMVPQYPRQ